MQKFTVKIGNVSKEFDKKVAVLDLLSEEQKADKSIVCAKVNNRIRELTYEIYYDAEVEFLDLKSTQAMKMYEASLRYLVSMAFSRAYPNLKIRLAYNISRCISVHLLDPKMKANNAMFNKVNEEMHRIVAADYPLKRIVVPNAEAEKIYDQRGFLDKKDILKYRPEKTVHFYECDGY